MFHQTNAHSSSSTTEVNFSENNNSNNKIRKTIQMTLDLIDIND